MKIASEWRNLILQQQNAQSLEDAIKLIQQDALQEAMSLATDITNRTYGEYHPKIKEHREAHEAAAMIYYTIADFAESLIPIHVTITDDEPGGEDLGGYCPKCKRRNLECCCAP